MKAELFPECIFVKKVQSIIVRSGERRMKIKMYGFDLRSLNNIIK